LLTLHLGFNKNCCSRKAIFHYLSLIAGESFSKWGGTLVATSRSYGKACGHLRKMRNF